MSPEGSRTHDRYGSTTTAVGADHAPSRRPGPTSRADEQGREFGVSLVSFVDAAGLELFEGVLLLHVRVERVANGHRGAV